MNDTEFYTNLLALPSGANYVQYLGKQYLLRKETLLKGKLLKISMQKSWAGMTLSAGTTILL